MANKKRCHWYDDEGKPRPNAGGQWAGCRRQGSCTFAHPGDSDWPYADPVPPPPRRLLDHYDDYPRSRTKAFSPPRRSPPPPPPRRPPSPPPPPRRARTRSPPPPPRKSSPPRPRTPTGPSNDSVRQRGRIGPEPATTRTIIPPPPALPPKLANSSTMPVSSSSGPSKEPTREERMNAWVDRIKIMSDAVLARGEYLSLEKELHSCQRIAQSWSSIELPSEEKTRFTEHLTTLESQFESKKKELNTLIYRLIDTDFWPITPQNAAVSARGSIEELQSKVQDIYTTIQKMESLRISPNEGTSPPKPPSQLEPQNAGQPSKRRRVESEDVDMDTASTSVVQTPKPATTPDLEALKDRVLELEDKISEIQNDLVQHDDHTRSEIQEEIEKKIEEYGISPAGTVPQPPPQASTSRTTENQYYEVLQSEMRKTDVEIKYIAATLVEMVKGDNERDHKLATVQAENEQMKKEILLLQDMQAKSMKALEDQRLQIDALKAAVTVYVSQSRPEPPPIPSIDEMFTSCRPQLIYAMRQEIQPVLEEMKHALEKLVETRNTEVCNVVLSKLASTLQTIETIAGWMESGRQQDGHKVIEHSVVSGKLEKLGPAERLC
ncbi:hypothetical protein BXZ70DRAFT_1060887 [Cristinia sonorae]|uniref:C3H1-type domain-containing protein n=1 Tax=Cristinia sonorae TaxID=1940300 RepID=A0A8K0UY66_9AGAR|nr:hypothetical protein BXZ70DRAFT_1060887 [Cristinia sonorae]